MSDNSYDLAREYVQALLEENNYNWPSVCGILESNLASMIAGYYTPKTMTKYIQERIKEQIKELVTVASMWWFNFAA